MKLLAALSKTALAAAALLLPSAMAALRIEATEVAPPAAILGEHQELVKTWTVWSEESLDKLHLALVGPVLVRYDATLRAATEAPTPAPAVAGGEDKEEDKDKDKDKEVDTAAPAVGAPKNETSEGSLAEDHSEAEDRADGSKLEAEDAEMALHKGHRLPARPTKQVVAKIVVSGNGTDLLSSIEVEALNKGKSNGLRVHLRNADSTSEGFVLTEIFVAEERVLRQLVSSIASSVVASDGVLVDDADDGRVRLSTTGEGVMLVDSTKPITLGHLDLDVTGSGLLQLRAPSLSLTGKVSPSIAGSGVIALHTDSLNASEIDATLSGSGAVYVEAQHLEADRIAAAIYGTANVSFHVSKTGIVRSETINVAGAGAVYTGTVVADHAKVNIRGAAEVFVQATAKLSVDASFSGDVYYVGPTPTVIKTSSWFWRTPVHAAASDKAPTHALAAPPSSTPEYLTIHTKHSLFSPDPIVKHMETAKFLALDAFVPPAALKSHRALHIWAVVSGVGGMCLLLVVGVQAWRTRRAHRQYQPLV